MMNQCIHFLVIQLIIFGLLFRFSNIAIIDLLNRKLVRWPGFHLGLLPTLVSATLGELPTLGELSYIIAGSGKILFS
jgi:hypothetical protein